MAAPITPVAYDAKTPAEKLNRAEFYPTRDKYGRPVKRLQYGAANVFGVVVTLPKGAEAHFGGNRYLVNNWSNPDRTDRDACVSYHPTLRAAKEHLRTVAAQFV